MIARTKLLPPARIDADSNGMLMSPEEFDVIVDYDNDFHYELIHGVLVVNPIPSSGEVGPNEFLGARLLGYQEYHANGKSLNGTLPERYIQLPNGRRKADRVIWAGLGRMPREDEDTPTIAVEFVSRTKRDRVRDFEEKYVEYSQVGIKEYWIIDRFERRMTVHRFYGRKRAPTVIEESGSYTAALLPRFESFLIPLFQCADAWTPPRTSKPRRKNNGNGR